jgi:hypothetical protein
MASIPVSYIPESPVNFKNGPYIIALAVKNKNKKRPTAPCAMAFRMAVSYILPLG